jgi:hypothetical protein
LLAQYRRETRVVGNESAPGAKSRKFGDQRDRRRQHCSRSSSNDEGD